MAQDQDEYAELDHQLSAARRAGNFPPIRFPKGRDNKKPGVVLVPYKPNRKRKGGVGAEVVFSAKKRNLNCAPVTMDGLPDAILISILSRLRIKEAARTSVLSRRWRPLWTLTGSLDFSDLVVRVPGRPLNPMPTEKFKAVVDRVWELHQAPQLDKFIVWARWNEGLSSSYFDELICRAMMKEPKELKITLRFKEGEHEFPHLYRLLTHTRSSAAFGCLKSLDLTGLHVDDEMVHCLLASCRNLESLTICYSYSVKNLRIVDPLPKLKTLLIACCLVIQSLEISVASLVSCQYIGREIDLQFKNVANLPMVTLGGAFSESFVFEAFKHLHYSSKLERLHLSLPYKLKGTRNYLPSLPHYYYLKRLEVTAASVVGRSLLFLTILLKACPSLNEFIITVVYNLGEFKHLRIELPRLIPKVEASKAPVFHHENLKVVELHGYIGCSRQEELLIWLLKIAPSLGKVVIGCISNYIYKIKKRELIKDVPKSESLTYTYHAKSFHESRKLAKQLRFKIPLETELIIL